MNEVIVEMHGISKSFGGIRALDQVHIELNKGEDHALMGENGAGKSTLMKILTGVYQKDEGRVLLRDLATGQMEQVEVKSPLMWQQLGLSMVFQELNLLENMTVEKNICLGREPVKRASVLDRQKLNEMAMDALKEV